MGVRRTIAVVSVALLLVTAGCAGLGGDGAGSADGGSGGGGGDAAGGGDGARADDAAQEFDADVQVGDRQVIRTGEVELVVEDAAAASEAIRETTAERGGFVGASSRRVHEENNETWRSERIVVRVPSEEFDDTIAEIESLGEVQRVETDSEDVTDQLVDLEARLDNLRAERDRLRELYEDANDTEDVLAVQDELSDVQEEIERLEAKKQRLERDVAYSTVTIHLTEEEPDPVVAATPAWYETDVVAAFAQSVNGVVVVLRAIVVGTAYVAPYAIVFGTPALGALALYRRRFG